MQLVELLRNIQEVLIENQDFLVYHKNKKLLNFLVLEPSFYEKIKSIKTSHLKIKNKRFVFIVLEFNKNKNENY